MARAHYDIYRDRLATTHASFGYALWNPGPEAGYGPVRIGDVGYVSEGQFHRLFNVLPPLGDAPHEEIPLPEYHKPLILNLPNHITTAVLSPNNCCSAGVNVLPEKPEHLAINPPDYPQFSFLCTTRDGGAVLSLPVNTRHQYTRARQDFGKWMLEHIDSWFAFARGLGLGIDMEEIILVTSCHHTRTWANVVFLENQTRAQASFGVNLKATPAEGREAKDYSINLKWDFPLGSAQGAVCSQGPEGDLNDQQEDQCIFIRGFRVVRRLGIFPKQLRGGAGPNPSLDEDQDNDSDKELSSIPAVTKTRDHLHVLLDHIVGRSPDCDMVLVHDDDLARIARLRDSDETLQSEALMDYLQQTQPEIHQIKYTCPPTSEHDPRNVTEHTTVVMFLEEFHAWSASERRDHSHPSLSDRDTGSGVSSDRKRSMSPSDPYLCRSVSDEPAQSELSSLALGPLDIFPSQENASLVYVPSQDVPSSSSQSQFASLGAPTDGLLPCPICRRYFRRHQDRVRHVQTHLPYWLFCPSSVCSWRGDRPHILMAHWRREHADSGAPPERVQCMIYDPNPLVQNVVSGVLSMESATEIALETVKIRAHELGKVGIWAEWWGRKQRVHHVKSTSTTDWSDWPTTDWSDWSPRPSSLFTYPSLHTVRRVPVVFSFPTAARPDTPPEAPHHLGVSADPTDPHRSDVALAAPGPYPFRVIPPFPSDGFLPGLE